MLGAWLTGKPAITLLKTKLLTETKRSASSGQSINTTTIREQYATYSISSWFLEFSTVG